MVDLDSGQERSLTLTVSGDRRSGVCEVRGRRGTREKEERREEEVSTGHATADGLE